MEEAMVVNVRYTVNLYKYNNTLYLHLLKNQP